MSADNGQSPTGRKAARGRVIAEFRYGRIVLAHGVVERERVIGEARHRTERE